MSHRQEIIDSIIKIFDDVILKVQYPIDCFKIDTFRTDTMDEKELDLLLESMEFIKEIIEFHIAYDDKEIRTMTYAYHSKNEPFYSSYHFLFQSDLIEYENKICRDMVYDISAKSIQEFRDSLYIIVSTIWSTQYIVNKSLQNEKDKVKMIADIYEHKTTTKKRRM